MSDQNIYAGLTLGDFVIEKQLGTGGMGVVYRARQISLNRPVALKVLGSRLNRPSDITRFQREAQAAAKLSHPGITSIFYVGQDDQICYMAMELVEGRSLSQVVEDLGHTDNPELTIDTCLETAESTTSPEVRFDNPFVDTVTRHVDTPDVEPIDCHAITSSAQAIVSRKSHIRRAIEISRDAGKALSHAHQQGVIHRDLKPANLMLDKEGHVHIVDFGLARFFEDVNVTNTGELVGTPAYMSPEQVTGRLILDNRTDIYSLGMVLHELVTLRRPITEPTMESVLRHIVTKSLPPVSWRNKTVSPDLEAVIHKAIAKDPEQRYQSVDDFVDDLESLLNSKSVSARPYHYALDASEIRATRPFAVILSSGLLFFFSGGSALAVFTVLAELCYSYMLNIAVSDDLVFIAKRNTYWFLPFAAVACVTAIGLMNGRRIARWLSLFVSSVASCVALSFYDMEDFYGGTFVLTGLLIISTVAVWISMCRPEVKRWFVFAGEMQREHKEAREGVTVAAVVSEFRLL